MTVPSLEETVARLAAENAELRARAEHAEGELSARDAHTARWETEKARADKAEAELAEMKLTATVNGSLYRSAEADVTDQMRELAEARAALERVRRLCELTIAASARVQAIDQARDTLAALDAPQRREDTTAART